MTPIWFLSLLHVRQRMYRRPAKRIFDVFAASVGLVLAVPLIALLALLIKRTPGRSSIARRGSARPGGASRSTSSAAWA